MAGCWHIITWGRIIIIVFGEVTIDGNGEEVVIAFYVNIGKDAREKGFDFCGVFAVQGGGDVLQDGFELCGSEGERRFDFAQRG